MCKQSHNLKIIIAATVTTANLLWHDYNRITTAALILTFSGIPPTKMRFGMLPHTICAWIWPRTAGDLSRPILYQHTQHSVMAITNINIVRKKEV